MSNAVLLSHFVIEEFFDWYNWSIISIRKFLYLRRLFSESVDGRREGGSWNAEENVHSPGLTFDGWTMDAEGCLLPQIEADEQH